MKFIQNLPLKHRMTSLFIAIPFLTVFVFSNFLVNQFTSGLEESAKLRLLGESNAFSRAYEKDPSILPPKSYALSFHFDQLPEVNVRGVNLLGNVVLKDDEFQLVFGDEVLGDDSEHEALLIIYRKKLHDGRIVYAIAKYDFDMIGESANERFDNQLVIIFYISSGYLLLVILALWFYSYRVGKKTEQLVDWSEKVSIELLDDERPDFKFDEYNRLAECLEKSLRKNAKLVEREKKFLSHASHELRTPIAIIRANMEILEKVDLPDTSMVPLQRIDRAGINMQLITETLLWLGRKSDNQPSESPVCIASVLDDLIEEQRYLIQGEAVDVVTKYEHRLELVLPITPIMIVLNNLLRNAFQYTHSGLINISYLDNCITVENVDSDKMNDCIGESFGLGLELSEKICKKLGWQLDVQFAKSGAIATLQLPVNEDKPE